MECKITEVVMVAVELTLKMPFSNDGADILFCIESKMSLCMECYVSLVISFKKPSDISESVAEHGTASGRTTYSFSAEAGLSFP
jgi:hypothetical protein